MILLRFHLCVYEYVCVIWREQPEFYEMCFFAITSISEKNYSVAVPSERGKEIAKEIP